MFNNKIIKLFLVFGVILFSLFISSCSTHHHNYSYHYDDKNHYKECECGEKLEVESHNFILIEENEFKYEQCKICSFKRNIISNNYNEISDSNIINGILDLVLDYKINVPDNQLSYNFIWEGYDSENKFGPCVPKERRFYTYLTEYKECDYEYYLVYLNTELISSYQEWLKEYENEKLNDLSNYHFTNYQNETIIDGKYFYCFQKLENKINSNIKVFSTTNIENIKYKLDNYQLVLCSLRKKAIIKENISKAYVINKEISLYTRYELIFNDTNSYPTYYSFDNNEKYNQNILKEMFDYVGEMIEAYPSSYENLDYFSFPTLGLGEYGLCLNRRIKVIEEETEKYVLLPRYVISNNEYLDLLSEETNLFFEEDVFRKYKKAFLSAMIKETNVIESFYVMALYDYNKVINIIN